jgi:hypothetical protein
VDQLQTACGVCDLGRITPGSPVGEPSEHRPDPLAAGENCVSHRLPESIRPLARGGEKIVERPFDGLSFASE